MLGGKTMQYEPLLAHQMAKQRVNDILSEAEQARLSCVAKGSKGTRRLGLPLVSIFSYLVAMFARPFVDKPLRFKSAGGGK
jgi:hypothetical protein